MRFENIEYRLQTNKINKNQSRAKRKTSMTWDVHKGPQHTQNLENLNNLRVKTPKNRTNYLSTV